MSEEKRVAVVTGGDRGIAAALQTSCLRMAIMS